MTEISSSQEGALKTNLLQLECRFTWGLRKDDIKINNLQITLKNDIELNSNNVARLYSFLAYVEHLQGYPGKAMENLQKAEELTREHHGEDSEKLLIVIYGDVAWLYYHVGDYTKCQSYLKKLKEIQNKFPTGSASVLHPEVYGEKGWTFLKFSPKYYDKAIVCFKKALELEPEEKEWNTGYAIVLCRTEQELSSPMASLAVRQLRRAIDIDPQDTVLMVLLALKLTVYHQYMEAGKLVEKALEMSSDSPNVTRYVAIYLRQQGQVDESIALLTRALERTNQSAFIHHQLALCYKRKKQLLHSSGNWYVNSTEMHQLRYQSIHHLKMAISLDSSFIYAMAELAVHYGEIEEFAMAENLFNDTFEKARDMGDSLQMVHLNYGKFQQHQKRCELLAIQHYTEGLKLQKDTTEGKTCAEKLKKIAENRVSQDPRDAEALGILGFVHKMQGEKQQAIEWYEKALLYDIENDEYLCALRDLRL